RERAGLGIAVAIAQDELRCERQCAGNQLLRTDACGPCRGVGRDDTWVMAAAGDDERTRIVRRDRARENVERQRREEETGPEHAASTRVVETPDAAGQAEALALQIASSDSPSSASSAARRWASFAQKNSSSCGGFTCVPESIACAWPRWWIWCSNRCARRRVALSCRTPARRDIATGISICASVRPRHAASRRWSTACCADESSAHVVNGSSGSKNLPAAVLAGCPG